jgi:hypothetical protein
MGEEKCRSCYSDNAPSLLSAREGGRPELSGSTRPDTDTVVSGSAPGRLDVVSRCAFLSDLQAPDPAGSDRNRLFRPRTRDLARSRPSPDWPNPLAQKPFRPP